MHRYELKERIEQALANVELGCREDTFDLKRQRMQGVGVEPWLTLCCYKLDDNQEGDCDVSLRSMIYFSLALGCRETWGITRQPRRLLNYQMEPREPSGGRREGYILRGDTMNSYATTAHRYLQLLDQEREESERLNPMGENWEEVVLRSLQELGRIVSPAALTFIERVHTIGNMIPVPCLLNESGKEVTASFNAPRYRRTKDYWDLTLLCLYHYYTGQTIGGRTLEWLLPKAADCSLCRAWLDSFGEKETGWDRFVEQNLLQDFVNAAPGGGYVQPKELWPGHFTGDVLPNKDQCETFFANASSWIAARSLRMVMKVRETTKGMPLSDVAEGLLP